MNVVLGTSNGPIAIVVDSIGDVIEVDDSAFEPVPDTTQGAGKELILAACKLDSCLLFVLDVPAIASARPSPAVRP
jgi:purine-binding chemotaxis protein CheW